MKIWLVVWNFGDHSESGVVAAFRDSAQAAWLCSILSEYAGDRQFAVQETVLYDISISQ